MTFPHSIAEKGLSLGGSDGGVSSCFSFLSAPLTCCPSRSKEVSPHIASVDRPHSGGTRVSPLFTVSCSSLLQIWGPCWGQADLVSDSELTEGELGAQ